MQTYELDLTADIIDVRDIIGHIQDLQFTPDRNMDEQSELDALLLLMDDLKGNGGDEQWRGDWYPVTLIRDCHFKYYAQDLLTDCGDLPSDLPHYIEIDWDATARNIRMDYMSTKIDGVTYWFR